jgi:hypothetical protein
MTPEELAALHPRLYHLTRPDAVPGILRHGLLPPLALLDLHGADPATRATVLARRPDSVPLVHPVHGTAWITDNAPLDDRKLQGVLDDDLTPDDWRLMLAERVFLWPDEAHALHLAGARLYRHQPRALLVLDTLSVASAHAERVAISPINSGQTLYVPARRGRSTFAPLSSTDYAQWRRARPTKGLDSIKEVTVTGGLPDIRRHLLEVRDLAPRHRPVA